MAACFSVVRDVMVVKNGEILEHKQKCFLFTVFAVTLQGTQIVKRTWQVDLFVREFNIWGPCIADLFLITVNSHAELLFYFAPS
jgi:hypothetical protein